MTLYGSIPNRILHPETLIWDFYKFGEGKEEVQENEEEGGGGGVVQECFNSALPVISFPPFLLIVGPSPCDASVGHYDHFVPICPIFPFFSRRIPLIPGCHPVLPCVSLLPPPPPCPNARFCNYSEFPLLHDNKTVRTAISILNGNLFVHCDMYM